MHYEVFIMACKVLLAALAVVCWRRVVYSASYRRLHLSSKLKRLTSTLAGLLLLQLGSAQPFTSGEFTAFGSIGLNATSKNVPAAVALDAEGNIYVTGTSEPFERDKESDLPGADAPGLLSHDVYIAKLKGETGGTDWIIRTGTSSTDIASDLAIDTSNGKLYIVGRTSGQFGAKPRQGQHDAFIIKYDISRPGPPTRQWGGPVTFGSSSLDAGAAVSIDSSGEHIYVVGYTRGSLFRQTTTSDYDAFLVRVRTSDGFIETGVQFGSTENEYGRSISLPPGASGSIVVGCDTSRRIGNVEVTNMKAYKFRARDLAPLGSILVKTFSRETVSEVVRHPLFPDTVFFAGTSWLEEVNGFEFALKRVNESFDGESDIGDKSVAIDDIQRERPQYSKKFGSRDGKADKSFGARVDPRTGLLWLGGSTSGLMAEGVSTPSSSQIAFLALDPNEAEPRLIAQDALPFQNSFSTLSDFSFSANSSYILYAGTRANETTGVLYSVFGTLGIPSSSRVAVTLPPPVSTDNPAPASGPGSERSNDNESSSVLPIAIGGGVAGVALIVIIVCSLCAVKKVRTRSEELKHGLRVSRQDQNDGGSSPKRSPGSTGKDQSGKGGVSRPGSPSRRGDESQTRENCQPQSGLKIPKESLY